MPDPKQKKYDVTYLKMAQGGVVFLIVAESRALIVKNNRIISDGYNGLLQDLKILRG